MATALTPAKIAHTALTALGTPPAGDVTGNTISNSGSKTLVYIENGSTDRTIEVQFARKIDGQSVDPIELPVVANFKGFLKLGPVADYGSVVKLVPSNAELKLKAFELS